MSEVCEKCQHMPFLSNLSLETSCNFKVRGLVHIGDGTGIEFGIDNELSLHQQLRGCVLLKILLPLTVHGASIRNKLATTEQGCFSLKVFIDLIDDPIKSQLLPIIIGDTNDPFWRCLRG
ncbi:hypothetical protein C5167_019221 [Papaver somniferum]|uniref:Uncharacterized protein n=1 Tax=Papaver somniferum TaxID=3469 RepID=A0A4Y7IST1_PAPSO|nr:hypothetical protein C5167_019221 [Papaver somniferum]